MAALEWLLPSSLAFSSPALEQSFQSCIAGPPKWSSFLDMLFILIGWSNCVGTYLSVSSGLRALLSPTWIVSMVQPLSAVIEISLAFLCPTFHSQHRVVIGHFVMVLLILGMPEARAHLLWRDFVREPAPKRTLSQSLRAFAVENMYLSVPWFSILIGDNSRYLGLLMNTVWMLVEVISNRYICGLPYTGSRLVSMSPQVLALVLPATQWVRRLAEPHIGAQLGLETVSCPVALGFWQVVGWWLSCHCIIVVDILRRRAFLRRPAVLQLLSQDHTAAMMAWPFGNGFKVLHLVLMSVILSQLCVIWLVFLSIFD